MPHQHLLVRVVFFRLIQKEANSCVTFSNRRNHGHHNIHSRNNLDDVARIKLLSSSISIRLSIDFFSHIVLVGDDKALKNPRNERIIRPKVGWKDNTLSHKIGFVFFLTIGWPSFVGYFVVLIIVFRKYICFGQDKCTNSREKRGN